MILIQNSSSSNSKIGFTEPEPFGYWLWIAIMLEKDNKRWRRTNYKNIVKSSTWVLEAGIK